MDTSQEIIRFGLYRADLRAGELKKGQDTVPLQNLPFRLLAVLLREPGRVFTREELRLELWPADTFVDFERGISTAVNKLREALGDSAANPRFIETVGRRGYRFIAPVISAQGAAVPGPPVVQAVPAVTAAAAPAQAPAPGRPAELSPAAGRIGVRKRAAFVGFLIVVIALVVLAVDRIANPLVPRIVKMTQLTTTGKAERGALYTDGARLYFLERSGPTLTLMQTSVAGGEVVPAAVPFPQTILTALSPDRTEMLIMTRGQYHEKHAVWIYPIQGGGALRRVGDLLIDGCGWFPDGVRLLCVDGNEIFSVERDGSERRHLSNVEGGPWNVAWRPDGSSFRFSVGGPNDSVHLWEASHDGANLHRLLPDWQESKNECCGAWSPDGRNYVFVSDRGDLWLLREPSAWPWKAKPKPLRLTNGPTTFSDPVFSPDGKKIFVDGVQFRGYVTRFDPQERRFSRVPFPDSPFHLAYSHDGKWVAYVAGPGLWRSRIDGSDKLLLTAAPVVAIRPRWSPDDKKVLFVGKLRGDRFSAFIIPADGGAPQPVIENDPFHRDYADWSPDQQSIIVGLSAGAETTKLGITHVDLTTHQVSVLPGSEGLLTPRWSPRGDYVAAVSDDFKTISLFDTRSRTWKQVATANFVYKVDWERDGTHLLYQDSRAPGQMVFRLDPATGRTEAIADCSNFLAEGAMRCELEGQAPDGSVMFTVMASWANIYAFDVELP